MSRRLRVKSGAGKGDRTRTVKGFATLVAAVGRGGVPWSRLAGARLPFALLVGEPPVAGLFLQAGAPGARWVPLWLGCRRLREGPRRSAAGTRSPQDVDLETHSFKARRWRGATRGWEGSQAYWLTFSMGTGACSGGGELRGGGGGAEGAEVVAALEEGQEDDGKFACEGDSRLLFGDLRWRRLGDGPAPQVRVR